MQTVKIIGAKFIWVDRQTPGVELFLDMEEFGERQCVLARVHDIRSSLFDNGLVYLDGASAFDAEILNRCLPPKEIPEYPGGQLRSVTDDPGVMKVVKYFLNAIGNEDGAKFEAEKFLPLSVCGH